MQKWQQQSAEQHLALLEKYGKIGYWELDLSSRRMFWSPEVYRLFGIAPQPRAKRNYIREQLCVDDIPNYKHALYQLLTGAPTAETTLRLRKPDGALVYCRFCAERKGRVICGTIQDATRLNETANLLRQTRAQLEQKSLAYAKIGHDLRQPLQALKIYVSLLKEERLSPEGLNLVQKIQSSTDNLEVWLNNLFETAKLESGGIKCCNNSVQLDAFLSTLAQEYQEIARRQHLTLSYRGQKICVTTDKILLERIIRNLLSNAVKYSRRQIKMWWYATKDSVKIAVRDDGVGLDSGVKKHLFQAFCQAPEHRRLGSGLGLAIVKELAAIIKARVKVKTGVGKGTIFVIVLPL